MNAGPSIEISYSNLSMPVPMIFNASLSDCERHLTQVGADNFEVTPVKMSPFVGRVAYRGAMLEEQRRFVGGFQNIDFLDRLTGFDRSHDWGPESEIMGHIVGAFHSSFRQEQADDGLVARCFPKWPDSLVTMRHMQVAVESRIPPMLRGESPGMQAVLYPNFNNGEVRYYQSEIQARGFPDGRKTYAPFRELLFQPKADEWAAWGLTEQSSIEDIRAAMSKHGFTGITWDVFHGQTFEDPLGLCKRLSAAGLIHSVHLALDRKDMAERGSQKARTTKQADQAFQRSPEAAGKTLEGEMLLAIVHDWKTRPELHTGKQRRIVLEKPLRWLARTAVREDQAVIDTVKLLVAAA